MEDQQCDISEETYLKKVSARFGMTNCVAASTPMVAGTQLQEESVDQAPPEVVQIYQSMVGSTMYAIIQTRPNICYAATVLSRYNRNLNAKHMTTIKRVLRYLKGTINYGITYNLGNEVEGYTDADWAFD